LKIEFFFGVSSQRPATTCDEAKVVSKSASSESGEHNNLHPTKSITASSSGSLVMEKSDTRDEKAEIFVGIESDNFSLFLQYKSCEGTSKLCKRCFLTVGGSQ